MRSYITKARSVSKASFGEKGFSLSGKDYRYLKVNANSKTLSTLVVKPYQGKEIGSSSYMKHSKYRFLKTVNLAGGFSVSEESVEYCRPENVAYPQYGDILIAKDGGGDGLGECALYNLQNTDKTDFVSAGVLGLRTHKENRYYLLGILKSRHFKNFIDLNTPQGSTIRHSKKVALDYPVPILKDKKIEDFVSLIVQNILDKEEQIKLKNEKIDELIEKELKENQNFKTFEYRLPRISDIKSTEHRFDSKIHGPKFRNILFALSNYNLGTNTVGALGFTIRRGQNLQVSCVGLSYYSDIAKGGFRRLVTASNLSNQRTISSFGYIGNMHSLQNIRENDIMISATGNVGKTFIFAEAMQDTTSNINSFFLNHPNKNTALFVGLFLGLLSRLNYFNFVGSKSNGGSILDKDVKAIPVPNFAKAKQEKIAKEYYNPININLDLNSENYLEKEKARNIEAGIFQLNMELFLLREKLENLIEKIVNEEEISISFDC